MDDLKKFVKKLIFSSKVPTYVASDSNSEGAVISYVKNDMRFSVNIIKKMESYECFLYIFGSENQTLIKEVELSEKEYMELKWQIENWLDLINDSLYNQFKEFAESEDSSMDDLLND